MKKRHFSSMLMVTVCLALLLPAGCQNEAQTDALIGGAVGAGVGQAVGRDTEGTLIGAAAGAGLGYLWGSHQDKKKAEEEQQRAQAQAAEYEQTYSASATETVWITNSNGSKTSVVIRKEGDAWYGPKGERYDEKPTEDQLREVYGF